MFKWAIILLISTLFLSSCASSIKNCSVKPNVEIDTSKVKDPTKSDSDIIDSIRDGVQPGGKMTCDF